MSRQIFTYILKAMLLIVLQAVVFNHLVLYGVAVPVVFIYAIISMPVTWGTNVGMLLGFVIGLCVDVFCDTLGVNTLACTVLTFVRKPEFYLYMQHDEDLGGLKPSIRSMGMGPYVKYALTMTLTYCVLLFLIDAFAIFDFTTLLMQIGCSTLYTFVLIYAIDAIFTRKIHT